MGMYRGNTMPVDSSARVSWVIPPELRAALAQVAAQHDRTTSAEARVALADWCRKHGVDPGQPAA
jgi:hypothetical protein